MQQCCTHKHVAHVMLFLGPYSAADMQGAHSMHVSEGVVCTCSPTPSALASGGAEATPLPSAQGLLQRTAGGQVSASRLSRQGDDPDVELGFLDEEQPSPSIIGGVSQPHQRSMHGNTLPLGSDPVNGCRGATVG